MTFIREDMTAMAGSPIVTYRIESRHWDGQVRATAAGVLVRGAFPTMNTEECVTFEETIARARIQARELTQGLPSLSEDEVDRILGPIPQYEAT